MNISGSIILIPGGALATSAYIISKKPEAGALVRGIKPQGKLRTEKELTQGLRY